MSDAVPMSRIADYKNQAAMLRGHACRTRYPEIKARLSALAGSFDKLAERVATRKIVHPNIA
jgi:hypothetical protein